MKTITKKSIKTLTENSLRQARNLVREYEQVKEKKHNKYRRIKDLFEARGIKRQNFYKFYSRYKRSEDIHVMLPSKRGRKAGSYIFTKEIQEKVLGYREEGLNRYDISSILQKEYANVRVPKPTSVYNILKRNKKNKMKKEEMNEKKRRIFKKREGEMGHIDSHVVSRGTIKGVNNQIYVVGIQDDYSRVSWVEITKSLKGIDVMFTTARCIKYLNKNYGIEFKEMLSDNGSEFRGNVEKHPFERLMEELGIRHRYTRPYRPQTNGKIERYWRVLKEELIANHQYQDLEELRDELLAFNVYYNEHRYHQGINSIPIKLLS